MQSAAAPSTHFIVQDLFATQEIHIIYGGPRSGRTTLALQIFDDLCHGRPVLGYPSYQTSACYLACERSLSSLRAHMKRMGLDPHQLPCGALSGAVRADDYSLEAAVSLARNRIPNLRVLFLDGILALCPGKTIDSRDAQTFFRHVTDYCYAESLTIIGTAQSVKAKENSGYLDPLERISGSGIISSATDTKILIERHTPKDITNPHRRIMLYPANTPERVIYAKFSSQGTLSICEPPEDAMPLVNPLTIWLDSQPDEFVTSDTLTSLLPALDCSRATLYRWIDDQCELGTLERRSKGTYWVMRNRKAN